MGRRPQDRRRLARALAASRRALPIARADAVGARSRSGGAFPSQQRRSGRAARLAGRPLAEGLTAIGWAHGQLSLPAWGHRGQSRGLPRRGAGRRLLYGTGVGARGVNPGLAGIGRGPAMFGRTSMLEPAAGAQAPPGRSTRAWRNWQTHWI